MISPGYTLQSFVLRCAQARSIKSLRNVVTRVPGREPNSSGSLYGNVSTRLQPVFGRKRKNWQSPIAKTLTAVAAPFCSRWERREQPMSVVCAPGHISLLQSPELFPLYVEKACIVGSSLLASHLCHCWLHLTSQS